MRTPIAFIFGALAATLVAAAAFRGAGQPLDSTFTYQGQLRNAGQLVNGNVDVRFTLWDSDVGGTQIGNANSFANYPLADGRFALGLNFGTGAFNGDQRWVQVEFRNPAGTGQYLTLAPRDKILAAPYALYALNSTASQWDYNPKTQALTSAQNVAKVGIGTNAPTAALEVVAAGGDDAVKLPAGSVGLSELRAYPRAFSLNGGSVTFTTSVVGVLLLNGDSGGDSAFIQVDDVTYGFADTIGLSYRSLAINELITLQPGAHTITAGGGNGSRTATAIWMPTN